MYIILNFQSFILTTFFRSFACGYSDRLKESPFPFFTSVHHSITIPSSPHLTSYNAVRTFQKGIRKEKCILRKRFSILSKKPPKQYFGLKGQKLMQLPIKGNSTHINHLLLGHYLTATQNTYTSETNFCCMYLPVVKIKQAL